MALCVYSCSIGPPLRNSYLERASDSYLLIQRRATFLYPVSYPPKVSNRVLFARVRLRTSIFLLMAAVFWKGVSPASNAPRFGVLAAETKTATSSHEQPITYVACRVLHLQRFFYHTKEKNSNTKRPIHIFCVYFIHHHQIRTWCVSYFISACCMLLLHVWPFLLWVSKTISLS